MKINSSIINENNRFIYEVIHNKVMNDMSFVVVNEFCLNYRSLIWVSIRHSIWSKTCGDVQHKVKVCVEK